MQQSFVLELNIVIESLTLLPSSNVSLFYLIQNDLFIDIQVIDIWIVFPYDLERI